MTLSRYRALFPALEPGTRYTIIVMWSNVLRRITKDAVATVAANISHRDDCTLYLVNTDQWWVSQIKRQ